MQNNDLSDTAAKAECKRLLIAVSSQRSLQNRWFSQNSSGTIEFDENSAFVMGMNALFRYARGEAVPPAIVMDFLDDLLKLMFCGLANNTMALPPFKRMSDRPWAIAWRLAELRLAFEGHESMDASQLAHLLGVPQNTISTQLTDAGYEPDQPIPEAFLKDVYDTLKNISQNQD